MFLAPLALLGALLLAAPIQAQSLSTSSFAGPTATGAAASPEAHALPGTTITHSATQNIVPANSVSCNAGSLHTDNFYYRTFDLASFGISGDFDVTNVEIGIETATGAGGTQPIEARLYTLAGPLAVGNLTLLGTVATTIADQSVSYFSFAFPSVTVPAGSILVVEIFTPSGQADGNTFFIGSNADGQTAPSYLRAPDCGAPEITDVAVLGFPGMNMVMNVTGVDVPVGPPISLTYLGSTDEPTRGDYVFMRARADNVSTSTIRTRVFFTVAFPDGRTRTYSVLSKDFPGGTSHQVQQIKRMKFPIPFDAPAGTYTVTMYAADDIAAGGAIYDSDVFTFDLDPIALPKAGDLASGVEAGPNPFRSETTIRYTLADAAEVDLRVFDVTGREVAVLASGVQGAGTHSAAFAAGDLPNGVYVWRLAAGGEVTTGRVTLVR